MSIVISNNEVQEIEPEVEISEKNLNISNLAIPFSIVFKRNFSPDIYNGEENIAFNDKDIEFKEILINEFSIHQ